MLVQKTGIFVLLVMNWYLLGMFVFYIPANINCALIFVCIKLGYKGSHAHEKLIQIQNNLFLFDGWCDLPSYN